MSLPSGNYVELEICWRDWLQVKSILKIECGFDAKPDQMSPETNCTARFNEIALPHWQCVKDALDSTAIDYQYIDRSEPDARWQGTVDNCGPCET